QKLHAELLDASNERSAGQCSGGNDPPDRADRVNGNSAGGIVDFVGQINVNGGQGHNDPGNRADEDGPVIGGARRCGNGDQGAQESDNRQVHVRLVVALIAEEQTRQTPGRGGEQNIAGADEHLLL